MNGSISAGVLRPTIGIVIAIAAMLSTGKASDQDTAELVRSATELQSYRWDFGHRTDSDFDRRPDGWTRLAGPGYPRYVKIEITAHDPDFEDQVRRLDVRLLQAWTQFRETIDILPSVPPPILDAMVDRYLRIQLDGGQAQVSSPLVAASRRYQYKFSCRIMTERLRHDHARAEFVFLDKNDREIIAHSTRKVTGTTDWTSVSTDFVRPPVGAAKMSVRLLVERGENGLEDIRGAIGFDDIRIDQYPQMRITTDQALGVYAYGRPIRMTATIMGLPTDSPDVIVRIVNHEDREIITERIHAEPHQSARYTDRTATHDFQVNWNLPPLDPGFYRMTATIPGRRASTLNTSTTLAVIDRNIDGPPHGSFGWSLPHGHQGIPPKELAAWLANLGVAWVKYPCWLDGQDIQGLDEVGTVLGKLREAGVHTIGVLDKPPANQLPQFSSQGRKEIQAAQLFHDIETWKPLLSPVMDRLSLKVRTWQLGPDRDFSFLETSHLREAIQQIAIGLQGYSQPIDVAISWPWLEPELPDSEASWHAVCRSTDPPLEAGELDAFLNLASQQESSRNGPKTWLMLDPIALDKYDRESRIRDLVLRMATVRSHPVQAAFVSDPRDPQHGLLAPNGRPEEMLLPWRTTSRLIGNLKQTGSLQLRSKAKNMVFANSNRAVLLVWAAEPTEELIYLGEDVREIDVWGKETRLPVRPHRRQPHQRIKIDRVPKFIVGADPELLAFRMSVEIKDKQLDSFLGQLQKLSLEFENPTGSSLVGKTRLISPETWSIPTPSQSWEALPARPATQTFDVVLNNTAKIGEHELPLQFEFDTEPPKLFTVYRKVNVGPNGLKLNVTTKLLPNGDLQVQIEMSNSSVQTQAYDCMLFPPASQLKRQLITVPPGKTVRKEIRWTNGANLVGQRMLLRASELEGPRVLNYVIDITR